MTTGLVSKNLLKSVVNSGAASEDQSESLNETTPNLRSMQMISRQLVNTASTARRGVPIVTKHFKGFEDMSRTDSSAQRVKDSQLS